MFYLREYKDDRVDIELVRGDTLTVKIDMVRKDTGEEYIPQEGDTIRFAMKESYNDSDDEALIVKNIPISTCVLQLNPEDTKPLRMGTSYVYDIELTTAQGRVDTFIWGNFTILREVL